MTKTTPKLGRAESAVYELIQTNAHTPAVIKALYRREVLALTRAGLLTATPDGAFAPLPTRDAERPASVPHPAPSAPPPPPKPARKNLNVRIAEDTHDTLESLARDAGVTITDLIRPAIEDAVTRLLAERTAPAPTPRTAAKSGTRRITADNSNGSHAAPDEPRDGTRG